jgi:hypothetical protein
MNKLFLYLLKFLLPLLFGVHVFLTTSVMCQLAPLYHFYVQKIGAMKSNVGCCHHHHKRPASFYCHCFVQVSNVMPWPNCYGVFCLLICFSRWWSYEASMVSNFKRLLFLCVHHLAPIHCCFVCNLVRVRCCLCV